MDEFDANLLGVIFDAIVSLVSIAAALAVVLLIWWIYQGLQDLINELRSLRTDLGVWQEKNKERNL